MKAALQTTVLTVALALPSFALAATIEVQQTSAGTTLGSWSLLAGSGSYKQSGSTQGSILTAVPAGEYTFSVKAPAGADQRIRVYRGPLLVTDVMTSAVKFSAKDSDSIRILVSYLTTGVITVDSEPEGISFSLQMASGPTRTGTTPATYPDMEPGQYTVFYDTKQECEAQKHQERSLDPAGKISFFVQLNCGDRPIHIPAQTNKPMATGQKPPEKVVVQSPAPELMAMRLVQEMNMSEAVAGSTVRVTLSVRNTTRETLHDIAVVNMFDPAMLMPESPLPMNGTVNGSEMHWFIDELFAGQSWSVTFEAKLSDGLVLGDRAVLQARASSPDMAGRYSAPASAVAGVSVAAMPQTGETMDLALVLALMAGTAILTAFTIRRNGFRRTYSI